MKAKVRRQETRIKTPWQFMLSAARHRAKAKNLPYSLSDNWARERWTGKCEVSGIEFDLRGRGFGPKVYSPSIDQIEAKKGYTPENCRFVIWAVNALKHDGTDEDMYRIAKAIVVKAQWFQLLTP